MAAHRPAPGTTESSSWGHQRNRSQTLWSATPVLLLSASVTNSSHPQSHSLSPGGRPRVFVVKGAAFPVQKAAPTSGRQRPRIQIQVHRVGSPRHPCHLSGSRSLKKKTHGGKTEFNPHSTEDVRFGNEGSKMAAASHPGSLSRLCFSKGDPWGADRSTAWNVC